VLTCEICGQECKTAQGLSGHRRLKHLVVSGGSSGGDQSAQGSVSGGDQSVVQNQYTCDQLGGAAAAVAVVGKQSVEWSSDSFSDYLKQYQETGDPKFLVLLKEMFEGAIGRIGVALNQGSS